MEHLRKQALTVFALTLLAVTCGPGFAAEWTAVNTGLTSLDVHALAIDPVRPTTLYVGTGDGVFKSLDGGETWRTSGLAGTSPFVLVIDFVNPNTLYASNNNCSFKSADGGASWSYLTLPGPGCAPIDALAIDSVNPNILYVAPQYDPWGYGLSLNGNLLKSTDRGASWSYPPFPCPIGAFAISPLAPNTVYAAAHWDSSCTVQKSTDAGLSWSRTGLANTAISVLAIDPKTPSTLYAGTRNKRDLRFEGLFKSIDSGASWSGINHGLADLIGTRSNIDALVVDARNPSTLDAATAHNGVFRSSDGGASWVRFSDGLSNRNIRALALGPTESGLNVLYAGTAGGGIFKILDDGVVTDPVPMSRIFFVPVIVSSPDSGEVFYESELTVANRSTREATVEFTYTAAFGGGSGQTKTTLEAGRQRIVPDAIAYLRELGIPITESGNHYGTLSVRFYGLSSPDEAAVSVRTTRAVPDGRAGVAYPGLPMASLVDDVFLFGLRQDASYRTNVALQHAGEAQDGEITLRLRVYATNTPAPVHTVRVVLRPGGFYQVDEILHSNGLDLSSGYVSVERIDGYAPFHAYAVMHNRASPDSILIGPFSGSSSRLTFPAIPRPENGFRSELLLKNSSIPFLGDKKVTLSFHAVEHEAFPVKAEIALKQNEERMISDVHAWLRDFGSSIRGRPFEAVRGPLVVTVEDRTGGDLGTLSLGMRVWALNKGGPYGFSFPAVPAERESRSATWLFGLQQNADTRSNLAIVNLGAEPNRFAVELFNGETGRLAGRVENITLHPQGSFQLNSVLADYASGVTQGYARVVPSNTEPFITYAVIIDGSRPGERTGDGSIINSSP